MAKKTATRAKRVARRDWSAQDERELRKHSKNKTPVTGISKALKRTPGALRPYGFFKDWTLERKWQALPRFQQTRGVLRLLALWVANAYQAGFKGAHKDPLFSSSKTPTGKRHRRSPALSKAITSSPKYSARGTGRRLDLRCVGKRGRSLQRITRAHFSTCLEEKIRTSGPQASSTGPRAAGRRAVSSGRSRVRILKKPL
jgi:hypothetical protein